MLIGITMSIMRTKVTSSKKKGDISTSVTGSDS